MKRRKAIFGITIAGTGIFALASGYTWYNLSKKPDLAFVDGHTKLIEALAETIIPATDIPGAKEARVHEFIILIIKDCSTVNTQNTFIDGLKDLYHYSKSKYNKSYEDCSPEDQFLIMKNFEKKGIFFGGLLGKVKNRYLGKSFFPILKELTVKGYCTSMIGATQALSYVSIPGSYQGCIEMKPGQKAWAIN